MSQTVIVIAAVIVAIALLLLLYLLRGRKQHVRFGDGAVPPPPSRAPLADEGRGVASEVSAAIEDVVDQFVGLDAHPSGIQPAPGDPLTQLKGLGPRAATRLAELGVTRFEQIARWNGDDAATIDAQMGAFKGRIARDRWVDQAKLLAGGDRDAFEAEFGKLGG